MGKYTSQIRKPPVKKGESPHSIWRGIGCLMMVLIPILSIALAHETIQYGIENEWLIPYQLLGYPVLPDFFYKVRILRMVFLPITRVENLYAWAAFTVGYMIVIGGIISVVYAVVYRYFGPPRYGPFDEPPPKVKVKKYTR
jgi:hypothetical protein